MNNKLHKGLAWVLTLCMVLTLLPAKVLAGDGSGSVTADTSWYDAAKSDFTLTDEGDLLGMLVLIHEWDWNSGASAQYPTEYPFEGKTLNLGADIALTQAWGSTGNGRFAGTFDGRGHTISGFKLEVENPYSNNCYGFFDKLNSGAAVKNLTIVIEEDFNAPGSYGTIAGHASAFFPIDKKQNTIIDNCHVLVEDGVTITGSFSTGGSTNYTVGGGLVGYGDGSSDNEETHYLEIKNSTVRASGAVFLNFADFGGIAANLSGRVRLKNLRFEGTIESGANDNWYSSYGRYGGIFGIYDGWYVGYMTVENCCSAGEIAVASNRVDSAAGGIGGYMDKDAVNGTTDLTEFKNVHSSMDVSLTVQTETVGYGIAHVGGLIGLANVDSILGCTATGAVEVTTEGSAIAGGLVGKLIGTGKSVQLTVSDSFATGNVTNSALASTTLYYSYTGGLIGGVEISVADNTGLITNTYATGKVMGRGVLGGLIGRNGGYSEDRYDDSADIVGCYATGEVANIPWTAPAYFYDRKAAILGGLVGYSHRADITSSYATGKLTLNQLYSDPLAGGLVGVAHGFAEQEEYNTISQSYAENEMTLYVTDTEIDSNWQSFQNSVLMGGFAGQLSRMNVNNSYAKTRVIAEMPAENAPDDIPAAVYGFAKVGIYSAGSADVAFANCFAALEEVFGAYTGEYGDPGDINYYPKVFPFTYYDQVNVGTIDEPSYELAAACTDCLYLALDGKQYTSNVNQPSDASEIASKTKVQLQKLEAYDDWEGGIWNIPTLEESDTPTANAPYATLTNDLATKEIASMATPTTITVPLGTPFERLNLPVAVDGTMDGGVNRDFVVSTWSSTSYNPDVADSYTLSGAILLDAATANAEAYPASVTVVVVPKLKSAKAEGELKVGETLTAAAFADEAGTISIATDSFAYQWQCADAGDAVNWADISSATNASYTMQSGDVGKYLRVNITQNEITKTSPAVGPVGKNTFPTLPVLTVDGVDGEEITLKIAVTQPKATAYTVYYLQSDPVINTVPEAFTGWTERAVTLDANTGVSYQTCVINGLTLDKNYYFFAVALLDGYEDGLSSVVCATPTNFPTNENTRFTAPYTDLYVGETQTYAAQPSNPGFTYAWAAAGSGVISLSGTNTQSMDVTGDKLGQEDLTLTVSVDTYSGTKTEQVRVISALAETQTFDKTAPKVGESITVTPALVDGAAERLTGVSYSYQWIIGDADTHIDFLDEDDYISGATGASYTPIGEQGAMCLYVKITLTNNGKSESKTYYAGQILESNPEGSLTLSAQPGSGKITLSVTPTFTAPAESAYSGKDYKIYYRKSNQTPAAAFSLYGSFASFPIEMELNLDYGVSYDFYVTLKADGYNPLTSAETAETALAPLVGAVITDTVTVGQTIEAQYVMARNSSSDTVGTKPALSAVSFQWQRSSNNSDWADIDGATDSGYVLAGTDYGNYVRLAATGDGITAAGTVYSPSRLITGAAAFSTAPAITAAVGANGQVTLTWTPSVPAADSYTVTGGLSTINDASGGTTVVTGLTNGTNYNFRVTAVKLGYEGGESAAATAMPFVLASGVTIIRGDSDATAVTTPEAAGPVSFQWTVSPAGAVTFGTPTQKTSTVTPVLPGDYTLRVTVTSKNGSTVTDTLTETSTVLSDEAQLLTFSVDGYAAQISGTSVSLTLPYGTDLTALIPEFTLSAGASVKVDSETQVSGINAQDFTSQVVYVVTAQDDVTTANYTVTVTNAAEGLEPLETPDPDSFSFEDSVAVWAKVDGAVAYLVQLYRDGVPEGAAVSVSDNLHDFLSEMSTRPGSYSFAVSAVADPAVNFSSPSSQPGGSFVMRSITAIAVPDELSVEKDASDTGLPSALTATLSDGTTVQLPVTWAGYSSSEIGTYLLTGTLVSLPDNVINYNGIPVPTLIVRVVAGVYTITANAGTGGTITPSGAVSVAEGDSRSFTISPNSGYRISAVLVDGVSQSAISTYTFTNVTDGHTITASFVVTGSTNPGTHTTSDGGGSTTPASPIVSTGNGAATAVVVAEVKLSGTAATAFVSNDTIKSALEAALKAADASNMIPAVEITAKTPEGAKEIKFTVPSSALAAFAESEAETLTMTSGIGTVALSAKTAASIAQQAGSSNVSISIAAINSQQLNAAQQAAVGNAPVYDISVTSGSTAIHSFNGGTFTITLPYALTEGEDPTGVVVWYVDDLGNIQKMECVYDEATQTVAFTTNHLSKYAVAYDETAAWRNPYADISASDWYYDAVSFVTHKGLMNGTGTNTFSPLITTSRGMLVTILYRLEGTPTAVNTSFTDVPAGEWYTDAVAWAAANLIVTGYGNGKFGPNDAINREQTAVILKNYAAYKGYDTSEAADLSKYSDLAEVSTWAAEAMKWANAGGLINGLPDGILDPNGSATRCQIATILMRFYELTDR